MCSSSELVHIKVDNIHYGFLAAHIRANTASEYLEQLDEILLRLKIRDGVDRFPGSPSPTENLTSLMPNTPNHKGSETGASLSDEADEAIAQLDAGANIREDRVGESVSDEQDPNFNLSDDDLEQLVLEK